MVDSLLNGQVLALAGAAIAATLGGIGSALGVGVAVRLLRALFLKTLTNSVRYCCCRRCPVHRVFMVC